MPPKDHPKIPPELIERALALQAQGFTQARIAAELGISRLSVIRHLGQANRRALERIHRRLAGEKGRQLAVLDNLIEQLYGRWIVSTQDHVTVKETDDGAGVVETVTTTRGQAGDPRLLAELMKALAERRKILGIDREGPDDSGDDPMIVAEMLRARYAPEEDEDDDRDSAARAISRRKLSNDAIVAFAEARDHAYNPEHEDAP